MTLVSRVLGLVRELVFAALLGAGYHSDAFRIGFRIPNLLRDLFAEGALSAAFVPTYARTQKEGGREAAFALANRVLTLLAVLLGVVVVLAVVFAWPLVSALAPGFDDEPGKAALTVLLTRVMMPFLPLVSFAAVAMGMLNAEERFGIPALSPALFNVVAILWAVGALGLGLPLEQVVIGWALGTLAGRARPVRGAGARRCGGWAGASGPSGRRATRASSGWPGSWRRPRWAWPPCRSTSSSAAASPPTSPGPCPGSTTPSACSTCRSASSAWRSARSRRRASPGARPRATWRGCATPCASRSRCWPT